MERDTKVIAVSGKGGVGKTSLSAAIVRLLTEQYPDKRILAIDADPAIGLATALGIEVEETLDDIRKRVANDVTEKLRDTQDVLAEAKFRLIDAMKERNGFAFIAIGRPEAAGCYCAVNTYLREVISMLIGDFDFVVIDGEAGIEQINRRVMEKVTHLLLISDQSKKGIGVLEVIREVADELVMYDFVGAVINRATKPELAPKEVAGAPVLAVIEPDEQQTSNDIVGESVFTLDKDSVLLKGAKLALSRMEIIPNGTL